MHGHSDAGVRQQHLLDSSGCNLDRTANVLPAKLTNEEVAETRCGGHVPHREFVSFLLLSQLSMITH